MHRTIAILVVLVTFMSTAAADGTRVATGADPDVTARRLRADADEQFVAGKFEAALAGYTRALAHWNHPKLQFSIGLCQLELRDWVSAAEAFEAALDAPGLTTREIADARDYLAGAVARTATIEIENHQGATISIDGTRTSSRTLRVLPGVHVVVARRGDATATESVRVHAGESRRVTPIIGTVHVRTRWARWIPWTVTGSGVALAAVALPMLSLQRDRLAEAKLLANGCFGCDRGDRYDSLIARADTHRRHAMIAGVAGGAIVLTGLILIAANRPVKETRPLPVVSASDDGISVGVARSW